MSKINKSRKVLVFAGIVIVAFAAQAKATVDSNFVIKDNIEYYFQTDKSVYDLGETVNMLYRITNLGDESVLFRFGVSPVNDRCDFMVDEDGERVWDNLIRVVFPLESQFYLSPLGSKSFTYSWDMTDLNGGQILPGNYDVTAALSYIDLYAGYKDKHVPVSVDIQVIPEPASVILLGGGSIVLLSCRKKRK